MISFIQPNGLNLEKYEYPFNNKIHTYHIYVNSDIFKAGADSLAYINICDIPIATIFIEDYVIVFKATGSCLLRDNIQNEFYTTSIPEYLIDFLDSQSEYNLYKLNITIEERNQFEFTVFKKDGDELREYSLEFHKEFQYLDSSLESFKEELKSAAIFFIQGDYLSLLDDFFDEDTWELPPPAEDEFENFCDYATNEDILDYDNFLV